MLFESRVQGFHPIASEARKDSLRQWSVMILGIALSRFIRPSSSISILLYSDKLWLPPSLHAVKIDQHPTTHVRAHTYTISDRKRDTERHISSPINWSTVQLIGQSANNFIAPASAVPWKPIERTIGDWRGCSTPSGTRPMHYALPWLRYLPSIVGRSTAAVTSSRR